MTEQRGKSNDLSRILHFCNKPNIIRPAEPKLGMPRSKSFTISSIIGKPNDHKNIKDSEQDQKIGQSSEIKAISQKSTPNQVYSVNSTTSNHKRLIYTEPDYTTFPIDGFKVWSPPNVHSSEAKLQIIIPEEKIVPPLTSFRGPKRGRPPKSK
ncbi:hypothetical protein RF11_15374 [Thelohanellus kitauei]|uniref:Uncharacterized protein n=1 Tax=Thelohanellus kitauei TaxID=669202 RepID=A0A0C2ITY0_THEKT|nr:hypothetical protein RF11_15374 [Thelohanellus kitauei]